MCNIFKSPNSIEYEYYPSVTQSKRIANNLSSGRKIFRFLKFIEELRKMEEFYYLKQKKPIGYKIITFLRLFFSFLFYICDNLLWLATVGILKKTVIRGL